MASYPAQCPDCGNQMTVTVTQTIVSDSDTHSYVYWSEACACSHCGYENSVSGTHTTPDYIRNAILQSEGAWALHIRVTGNPMDALHALRAAFDMSMHNVVLDNNTSEVTITGTLAEVECLRHNVTIPAITTSIQQVGAVR